MGKNSYDITARGSVITITYGPDEETQGNTITLEDFGDEYDPLMIDELHLGEVKFDINGDLYRASILEPVTCHISVLPGSEEEKLLNKMALEGLPLAESSVYISNMQLQVNTWDIPDTIVFSDGYLMGASMGYAITSQGRIRTKQFSFGFKSCGKISANN